MMYWIDVKDGENAQEMGVNANMLGKEELRGRGRRGSSLRLTMSLMSMDLETMMMHDAS
jgi:hypothetical protein